MNDNLKRWTAIGLAAIVLLVVFFAEYTHRHPLPATGQTAVAQTDHQPSGKSTGQQISHVCFICQITSVAVEIVPTFDLAVFAVSQSSIYAGEFVSACSAHFDISLRRGPPAFLA
ncbi:MAG: hypothetical protein ACRENG_14720 [bacterium]